VIRAVFFDAGGTLLRPAEPVGRTYARLATHYGWAASEERLDQGFRAAWKQRTAEGAGPDGTLGREGWKKILWASVEAGGLPDDFPFPIGTRAYAKSWLASTGPASWIRC